MDNWYSRVKDEIRQQQEDPVWMSEDKVREDLPTFTARKFDDRKRYCQAKKMLFDNISKV